MSNGQVIFAVSWIRNESQKLYISRRNTEEIPLFTIQCSWIKYCGFFQAKKKKRINFLTCLINRGNKPVGLSNISSVLVSRDIIRVGHSGSW